MHTKLKIGLTILLATTLQSHINCGDKDRAALLERWREAGGKTAHSNKGKVPFVTDYSKLTRAQKQLLEFFQKLFKDNPIYCR